jgi:hypothetical protein
VLLSALPITAGITPRGEDERGRRRRLGGDELVLMEDEEAAIEEFAQFDATASVGATARARRDLCPASAEPHGVVARDDAEVAAAQEAREIARRRAPRGHGLGRGAREALHEGGQELGEKRVGLLKGVQGPRAQFTDERSCSVPHKRSMRPLACGD